MSLDIVVSEFIAQIRELQEELDVTDKLLKERDKVMEAIPPCPWHGHQCVPHALLWIEKQKPAKESNRRE